MSMVSNSNAPPASFPCPYVGGGCPLFNSVQLPPAPSPVSCAGGCSPPDSSAPPPPPLPRTSVAPPPTVPSDPSLKLPPINTGPPSPARLPLPSIDSPFPRAFSPAGITSTSPEWNGYLDFGLQPTEVDLAPLYVPFPSQQPQQPQRRETRHSIWDIEELVPNESQALKRKRSPSPPVDLPLPVPPMPSTSTTASGLVGAAVDPSTRSPTISDEGGNEVVTPFISKLSYLLDHPEYEPWIRWDATGNYILIAHTKNHLLEILAKFFRHTTIASFVRQLNIYGFKRVTTGSLLSILENVSFTHSIVPPNSTTSEPETFSASDYSAFHNVNFFRSVPGRTCRTSSLKPITKERGLRNRSKKAQAAAAVKKKTESK